MATTPKRASPESITTEGRALASAATPDNKTPAISGQIPRTLGSKNERLGAIIGYQMAQLDKIAP
jgi:hypothetical protein